MAKGRRPKKNVSQGATSPTCRGGGRRGGEAVNWATVLIVEQYLDFVREFCQSFYIMNRGEMVANGITKDLNQQIIREYLSV